MSDEKPTSSRRSRRSRRSRFRRSSRFRSPSDSQEEGQEESEDEEEEDEGEEAEGSSPSDVIKEADGEQEDGEAAGEVAEQASAAGLLSEPVNVLTFNIVEWFHTLACSEKIKFSHWSKCERRVEHGLRMILAMLRRFNVKATFFVLGIIAREFPELVKQIAIEGHEVGTMGYYNRPLFSIPAKEYFRELEMSIGLLKSLTEQEVKVHRAPEWSVTNRTLWVFEILKGFGIKYDSSIYPVSGPFFGIENAPRFPYTLNPFDIIEFPPSTVNVMGKNIAMFSGAYFRVLPLGLTSMGLGRLNTGGQPGLISLNQWEIDGEFPKLDLGWDGFVSQYAGVVSTFARLQKLLKQFRFDTLTKVLEESPPRESHHINFLTRRRENFIR
ncbi:MAG: DUF3473 domain-containing protein [Vulcanimicrobiota bacterium]